jgi:hypothetical protein
MGTALATPLFAEPNTTWVNSIFSCRRPKRPMHSGLHSAALPSSQWQSAAAFLLLLSPIPYLA